MIRVFYDGACGLCAKEMNHYQKIAPAGVFDWCDVMKNPHVLDELGISLAQALKVLHAQDAQREIHQGIDAFILMWKQMPRWRVLACCVSLPLVYSMVCWAYSGFAAWRFKRLSHCQVAMKKEGQNGP